MMQKYKVYVQVDDSGRIVAINSDAFINDLEGWLEIGEGFGDRFHHAQGNYLPKPIFTSEGIPVYKIVMGEIKERGAEEILADVKPPEKSALEKRLERLESAIDTVTKLLANIGIK